MRIRKLGRISFCLPIALAAIWLIAPAASLASDEKSGRPHRDAVPGYTSPPDRESAPEPGYARVLIAPLEVGYTKDFLAHDDLREHRIRGNDIEKARRHYLEVVTSRLAPAYPISRESGPRVVRVDAMLIDTVIDKRSWLATSVEFANAPRVRLVVFLRDSRSGELLDTLGLTLRPRGGRVMRESPGFYWSYLRRVFDRIATRVRWTLEDGAAPS